MTGTHPPLKLRSDEALFAMAAVRLELLSREQLDRFLSENMPQVREAGLGETLVQDGLLTPAQREYLERVLRFSSERVVERRFGDMAIARGWASPVQISSALEAQKLIFNREHKQVPIGEMLVHQRILTDEQRDTLLVAQARARQAPEAAAPSDAVIDSAPAPASPAGADAQSPAGRAGGFSISVDDDHLNAFITLESEAHGYGPADLKAALASQGVVYGIDEAALARLCDEAAPVGEAVCVAQGTPAVPGRDEEVVYSFDVHPLKAGQENEDGTIDFRERGEVPQVQAGMVLARRRPGEEGKGGTDVYGKAIAPPKLRSAPMSAGRGASVDGDGAIIAEQDGHPRVSAKGVISVYPEYRIEGDLGLATGHVSFDGRVVVTGTVRAGFRVRCGELVAKELEQAEVHTEGDIRVAGGVMGATLHADGQVKAHYLHEATVTVLGDLYVDKEVVDSSVTASGAFHGEGCTIFGSRISANGGIFARQVGSENSPPCELHVGIEENVQRQADEIEAEAEAQAEGLEKAPETIRELRARRQALDMELAELAQVQDSARVKQRELQERLEAGGVAPEETQRQMAALEEEAQQAEKRVESLFAEQDAIADRIDALENRQDEVREAIERQREEVRQLRQWVEDNPGTPEVVASALLAAGTRITTPHKEVTVAETRKRAHLREVQKRDEKGETVWAIAL